MAVHTLSIEQLDKYGIKDVSEVIYNPSYDTLYAEETADNLIGFEKGVITENETIAVDTGIFTGRSPHDKYIIILSQQYL